MKKMMILFLVAGMMCMQVATARVTQVSRPIVNVAKEVGEPKKRVFAPAQMQEMNKIFEDSMTAGDVQSAQAVIRHLKQGDKTTGIRDTIKQYEGRVQSYKPAQVAPKLPVGAPVTGGSQPVVPGQQQPVQFAAPIAGTERVTVGDDQGPQDTEMSYRGGEPARL